MFGGTAIALNRGSLAQGIFQPATPLAILATDSRLRQHTGIFSRNEKL
ncbi:MAG: hypothetical protein ABSD31_17020 [Candidatus Binataceae bacterium]